MPGNHRPVWSFRSRLLVFTLAGISIACLLADFYRLCPMNVFTLFIFLPALLTLAMLAIYDRQRGSRIVWKAVWVGVAGGLIAAVAYDLFRVPIVLRKELGIDSIIRPMPLFKVFPRFGAMVLG